jgi:hypothetical protein
LQTADEDEIFSNQRRFSYQVPEYKRTRWHKDRKGWNDLDSIADSSATQLGNLFAQLQRMEQIEKKVLSMLALAPGQKVRVALDKDNVLTILVRNASLAHRIKFSSYAIKADIESALGMSIPVMNIRVKPDLI